MAPEDYQAPPITNETEASTPNGEQTLSKNETIELLQQSIRQLEQVVARLNVEETTELPESSSIRNLVTTAEALKTNMIAAQPETAKPETEIAQPETEPEVQVIQFPVTPPQLPTTPTKTPPIQKVAPKRRFQPILSIAVALVIAIALGTWLWLSRPLPQFLARTVEPGTEIPPEVTAPAIETPVTQEPQETVADTPETIETPEMIEVPPELTAPGKTKNLTVKPIPVEVKLTPEQNLIAAVKDKIAAISKEYPKELVSSVATNFPNSSLSVTISDRWYELDTEGQNRLARDLLKRSQELNFNKLTLQDPSQNLIARNPVVGDEMVIFLRETTTE
jgi:hypothetical protein